MNTKPAAFVFLAVCLILAGLLLFDLITSLVSGIIFAVTLALFGVASRGFRKNGDAEKTGV